MDLVGRQQELDVLRDALSRARDGDRQLVLLAGEPGIGKTSLVDAFRPAAVASGATWLSGAAWEDGAPSYWPWTQVVRAAGRVAEPLVMSRAAALGSLDPAGRATDVDRFVMYDAVADLIVELARSSPVVVVLEDLHAAGPATSDLLEFVHRATSGAPVLLVGTLRPAEAAASPALTGIVSRLESLATVLAPRPFGAGDVSAVLGSHGLAAAPALVETVLERTQGNPLFVVHTARGLAAGGEAGDTGLPLGLRDALRRQAAGLEPGSDGVLEAAAVLGEEMTSGVLAAMTGLEEAAVAGTLQRAVERGLLRVQPLRPGCYEFTHALVREAVYDGITPARAAEAHLRAGRALAQAGAGPDRLAWHFSAAWPAGGVAEAARYARLAGDEASRSHAHAEAAEAYRVALAAHDRLPTSDPHDRADLLLALAGARLRAGRVPEGHRAAAEAVALARALEDAQRFASAALLASSGLPFNAVHAAAVVTLREASERLAANDGEGGGEGGTYALHAAVVARLAELVASTDRTEAMELAERAELLGPELPAALAARLEVGWGRHDPRDALSRAERLAAVAVDTADAARAAVWELVFALELGDLVTAGRALTSLLQLAERSREPALAHLAISRRATLATVAGDAAAGLAAAREARELAARFGLADGEAVAWGQLFCVWRSAGLPEGEAPDMERIARLLAAASPYPIAHAGAVVQMLLARGEEVEAREMFARLVTQADGLERDLLYVWSLALLAEDAVRLADADAAQRIYAALEPFGDRFVVAAGGVACLGSASHQLGLLASLLGREPAARAHLTAAVRAHRAAGCTTLLAASELALAALSDGRVELHQSDGIVTVRLRGDAVHLPASLGLSHLAVLVEHAGSDIAASQLASLGAGESRPELSDGAVLGGSRGADDVLDKQALAAYRARLTAIDDELDEAAAWQDDARRERLETERDAVLGELRSSLGLGGRPRRFADEDERARVNVTRAIRSAIKKVAERSPAIGSHLEAAVSTGFRCRYEPADDST